MYAQPNDSSNLSKANVSRLRTEIATQITDIVAAVAIPGIVEVLLFLRTERIGTRSQEVLQHAISLFFIVAGVILSVIRSIQRPRVQGDYPLRTYFRKMYGGWLVVALDFQLASDIVATIISPTTEHLIEVGAIALIRTFLNYFLTKELNEEREAIRPVVEKKE